MLHQFSAQVYTSACGEYFVSILTLHETCTCISDEEEVSYKRIHEIADEKSKSQSVSFDCRVL